MLALPIGLLVDRLPRRRILVACDLARAVLVGGVVALATLDRLAFPGLLVLALVAGGFRVAYEICYLSVLPELVDRCQLAANRAVEVAHGGATIAGPGSAGSWPALTAAGALTLDALSFLVSGLLLLATRWPDRRRPAPRESEPLRHRVLVGAGFVRRDAHVGPLTAYLAVNNVFAQGFSTALLIFVIQTLALPPTLGAALFGAEGGLFNLQSIAIRQAVTPAPLLGRVTAVVKVLCYSAMALGAFLGGWLSGLTGTRTVIGSAAAGSLLATACLVQPAVRRLRTVPSAAEGPQGSSRPASPNSCHR